MAINGRFGTLFSTSTNNFFEKIVFIFFIESICDKKKCTKTGVYRHDLGSQIISPGIRD